MARGIEHKTPETLLDSFGFYNKSKWAIYAGNEQVICFDDDNIDGSRELLSNTLDAIANSGTNTVYTLKVYDDSITDIDRKSVYKGSTTFMFGGAPTKMENGVVVIDRDGGRQQYINSKTDPAIQQRITDLENKLAEERELRHKADIKALRSEFDQKISGLNDAKEEDPVWLGVVRQAIDKPEIIDKVFEGIGSLFDRFLKKNDTPDPSVINGTENKENMSHEIEDDEDVVDESGLSEDEIKDLEERLDNALDKLENKVGTVPMIEALEKISEMPDDKLISVLKML